MAHPSEARRGEHLRRQVRLFSELLRGGVLTRRKVASVLGVQIAAADRHLKALRELPGIREAAGGGLQLDRAAVRDPPAFPVLVAACLSNGLATLFRGTSYEAGMRAALDYLVKESPRRALFNNLDRKFMFVAKGGEASLADSRAHLDEIIEGVLRSRRVRIRYTRFGGDEADITIEPLTIAVYEHQLYVIARSGSDDVHPYRFSRIRSADVQTSKFEYPKRTEYDPEELLAMGFGIHLGEGRPEEIVLRLSATWATYALNHRWHRTQQVQVTDDGSALVTITVRNTPEVEAWALSFGRDAEVLSPEALRTRIADHARGLARTYSLDKQPLPRRTPENRVASSPRREVITGAAPRRRSGRPRRPR